MMLLAVERRLPQLLELQGERTWQPLPGRELAGLTVGIVGFGSIGEEVARLLEPFGTRIVATRRHADRGAGTHPNVEPSRSTRSTTSSAPPTRCSSPRR